MTSHSIVLYTSKHFVENQGDVQYVSATSEHRMEHCFPSITSANISTNNVSFVAELVK